MLEGGLATKPVPPWLGSPEELLHRETEGCSSCDSLISEAVDSEEGPGKLPEWKKLGGPGILIILVLRPLLNLVIFGIVFLFFETFRLGVGATKQLNLSESLKTRFTGLESAETFVVDNKYQTF